MIYYSGSTIAEESAYAWLRLDKLSARS